MTIVDIAVGSEHALVLDSNGEVYGWGCNAEGRLGLGHTQIVKEPQLIPKLSNKNIKQVNILSESSRMGFLLKKC